MNYGLLPYKMTNLECDVCHVTGKPHSHKKLHHHGTLNYFLTLYSHNCKLVLCFINFTIIYDNTPFRLCTASNCFQGCSQGGSLCPETPLLRRAICLFAHVAKRSCDTCAAKREYRFGEVRDPFLVRADL